EAMAELEALCAGLAAERMSAAERHGLEAIHEELRVLSYAGNPDRFHEVNERFHNAIYAGSQNGYIAEITLATRVRVQPFRRAQFRNLGRLAKSHAEHDRVVVAILRGDRTGAAAAMRAAIQLGRGAAQRPGGALLIRGPYASWVPDLRRVIACRAASGTREQSHRRFRLLRH